MFIYFFENQYAVGLDVCMFEWLIYVCVHESQMENMFNKF